jgi:hypothetical protein
MPRAGPARPTHYATEGRGRASRTTASTCPGLCQASQSPRRAFPLAICPLSQRLRRYKPGRVHGIWNLVRSHTQYSGYPPPCIGHLGNPPIGQVANGAPCVVDGTWSPAYPAHSDRSPLQKQRNRTVRVGPTLAGVFHRDRGKRRRWPVAAQCLPGESDSVTLLCAQGGKVRVAAGQDDLEPPEQRAQVGA